MKFLKKFCPYFNNQHGQILVFALAVLMLIIVITVLMISGSFTYFSSARYSVESIQATNLAEAGIDRAVAALNKTAGSYTGESDIQLGNGTYTVTVTSLDASNKQIESTGYVPNKTNPKSKRTIKIQVSKGDGVSFYYGVHLGDGGFELFNNSEVNGPVYSNGNIVMQNGSIIKGDVFVAGGVQPTPDQENSCSGANCSDFLFGKSISGEDRLDIAQSFKPTATQVINKVALNIKKFGSPTDSTVRILSDNNGSPNKNSVLASGTLSAILASSQYGFVEVALTTTPSLSADTTYWIVVDTTSNNSNYWSWAQDTLGGYTRGSAAWTDNWSSKNPTWTPIAGDLDFKVYMGGIATYIQGENTARVTGHVHANTIKDLKIDKDAYYQVIQNSTAANYHPGSTDPPVRVLPVSDANISEWKQYAEEAGVTQGSITNCVQTFGPGKIVGSVTLNNNCSSTFKTPVWITGDLTLDNGSTITLDATYGASSGVILTDGKMTFHNNGKLAGSGTDGSYMMAVSNYDSRTNGEVAIDSDNGSTSSILYAPKGIIFLHNGASMSEVSGWKLVLDNGSSITYSSGLADLFFTSGPGGNFSVVKGSYQVK